MWIMLYGKSGRAAFDDGINVERKSDALFDKKSERKSEFYSRIDK